MLEIQEGIREWEIWTPPTVNRLNRLWGTPDNTESHHAKFLGSVAELVTGETVLDVGCGCGHFYKFMRNHDYLGLDISEYMLNQARKYFPDAKHQFVKGDVYDLSMFSPRETVVANSVLLHLPEIEPAIHELWSKALTELIFNMHIGNKQRLLKRKGYGGNPSKYLISHTTTLPTLFTILGGLPNLAKLERFPYNNIVGDIFRLTRGRC